jgi:hypothetical protein
LKPSVDLDPKRTHDLTIEEVRSCPLFKDFTDEQAMEVIRTFKELTRIAFSLYLVKKQENL